MICEKMLAYGQSRSCIRELYEYGLRRKAEIGEDRVFDFSLGNPSIPAPPCVDEAIRALLLQDSVQLHGYTPAAGLPALRAAIAEDMNSRYDARLDKDLIYVTCGAAAGLACALRALIKKDNAVMAFAPFFPEYRVFAESANGVLVSVPPAEDLQPDLAAMADVLAAQDVHVVLLNSPNNPSGVVYSEQTLRMIAQLLYKAQQRVGHPIYILCDEPYRELVYDGAAVPCITHYYENSIICYSFSKSLSLPGERIGYLAVNPKAENAAAVFAAIAGAARACGYVNAPSMMQRVVLRCLGQTADISAYRENRDLLYGALCEMGYSCVKPQGAFYLFVKCPEADAAAFSRRANRHELLLVPADDFGVAGYVRISYCVSRRQIEAALPAFRALLAEYK